MAFRLSGRVLQQVVKKSTGLTGLDVVPNAREVLVKLYEKTLKDVQVRAPAGGRGRACLQRVAGGSRQRAMWWRAGQRGWRRARHASPRGFASHTAHLRRPARASAQIMPAEVPYRKAVEAFTTFRMNVVKENADVSWGASAKAQRESVALKLPALIATRPALSRPPQPPAHPARARRWPRSSASSGAGRWSS